MMSRIFASPRFSDIRSEAPLKFGHGGFKQPFSKQVCTTSLGAVGKFECAGNLSWVNESWSAIHGVPFNNNFIMKMANHVFAKPAPLSVPLMVPVPDKDFDVLGHKGSLKYAVPAEMLHAFWWALGRDLDNDAPEAVLEQWRVCILTQTMQFIICDDDVEIFAMQENARERAHSEYAAVVHTAFQKIIKVIKFKERLESLKGELSVPEVCKEHKRLISESAETEQMSDDLIRDAVLVHNKVLINNKCLECIMDCESKYGLDSPFNGIRALRTISVKAGTGARLEWIFSGITDGIHMEYFDRSEFSARKLAKSGGTKGVMDLLNFKYDIMRLDQLPSLP